MTGFCGNADIIRREKYFTVKYEYNHANCVNGIHFLTLQECFDFCQNENLRIVNINL